MALIDIEYGSLASSDIMNRNFLYLDNKISETSGDINTSISSLLSNIATINSRITELADDLSETIEDFTSKIDSFRLKTEILINNSTMVPDWEHCAIISQVEQYIVPSNGFILINPTSAATGSLIINGAAVSLKSRINSYDNSCQLMAFPVKNGDIVSCNVECNNIYFLPTTIFKYESLISNEEV